MRTGLRGPTLVALLFSVSAMVGCAHSQNKDGEGTNVKVTVVDEENKPVSTAVVRHPDEADRHRVNSMTGTWEGSVLYMPDGSELIFTPGMSVRLEVSAPGYMTQIIQYDIRKRKNNIEVMLPTLAFDEEGIEDPIIQFGRDKPRDVGGSGPAN